MTLNSKFREHVDNKTCLLPKPKNSIIKKQNHIRSKLGAKRSNYKTRNVVAYHRQIACKSVDFRTLNLTQNSRSRSPPKSIKRRVVAGKYKHQCKTKVQQYLKMAQIKTKLKRNLLNNANINKIMKYQRVRCKPGKLVQYPATYDQTDSYCDTSISVGVDTIFSHRQLQ